MFENNRFTLKLLLLTLSLVSIGIFIKKGERLIPQSRDNIDNVVQKTLNDNSFTKTTEEDGKTILFVGDIMLDRNVEVFMGRNGVNYPFSEIKEEIIAYDISVGNLEGPIVYKPIEFARESLMFNFIPETADALNWAGFDVLTLSNNHTQNRGAQGLRETKEILTKAGIDYVGDPVTCSDETVFKKDGVVFTVFNKTFPQNCSDDKISEMVKVVRSANPNDFLIAILHWGNEYQPLNSSTQETLAHNIIDSGADLVIGHHPHVVQNIEIYKNKAIFYSLGNFIFDQYFSKETQEGLAVGMEIFNKRVAYRLIPIQSKNSQPFLMSDNEKIGFLDLLAERSDAKIKDGILDGAFTLER